MKHNSIPWIFVSEVETTIYERKIHTQRKEDLRYENNKTLHPKLQHPFIKEKLIPKED